LVLFCDLGLGLFVWLSFMPLGDFFFLVYLAWFGLGLGLGLGLCITYTVVLWLSLRTFGCMALQSVLDLYHGLIGTLFMSELAACVSEEGKIREIDSYIMGCFTFFFAGPWKEWT
jgi:hypothetical protein